MKLLADKEFLKKLLETAERRTLRAVLAEMSGKDASRAKRDVVTIHHYFYFLANRAMDNEEFAEELHRSIEELRGKTRTLEVILLPIAQILTARYQFGVEIDRDRQREIFEEGFEDALEVINHYRKRWKIEDWHKALKTGCKIEERQLERWERMEVLLTIYSIIAWKVLELREIARSEEEITPEEFLTDAQIAVLEGKFPDLKGGVGREYAVAVAKVGGYLDRSSDPPPGWIVMWRGFKKVRTWAEGYEFFSSDETSDSVAKPG